MSIWSILHPDVALSLEILYLVEITPELGKPIYRPPWMHTEVGLSYAEKKNDLIRSIAWQGEESASWLSVSQTVSPAGVMVG